MSKKTTLIGGLVTLVLFGFAATSFAGMGIPGNAPNIGTEAGVDIVAGDQAKRAAANVEYSSNQLAQVGTEAGTDVVASNQARTAAASYDYNPELLAQVGTEAGISPSGVGFKHSGINVAPQEQTAGKSDANCASCKRC